MSPVTFVTQPSSWIEIINKYRATITAAPNFGLGVAAKYHNEASAADLSCLRAILCGAEPINAEIVRSFNKVYEPMGLNPKAVSPAYGLAESTLGGTAKRLHMPLRTALIDKVKYEGENIAVPQPADGNKDTIELVSCGSIMPNHAIGIIDEQGNLLEEGMVGEIVLKGPCVTEGYFNNPKASSELFSGEWMKSGDLGFILDDELYVSGRKKDIIIIAGRNYNPQHIEWCVENVSGVRKGNIVAFSITGEDTEKLVVVVECKKDVDIQSIKERIRRAISSDVGIYTHDVVLVEKNSLPKTSSGKLQRAKTKNAYQSGTLGIVS